LLFLAAVVVSLAGVVAGTTGFGFALVAVPVLMLLLPPRTVVPLIQILSLGTQAMILLEGRRHLLVKRVWLLILGGMVGVPAGTYLLLLGDSGALQTITGAVVILGALALAAGWRWQLRNERGASLPVGLMSGALAGSTGLPGPPVILFFTNQGVDKQAFRVNLALHFACLNVVAIASALVAGLGSRQLLESVIILLPALILGTASGIYLSKRVNQARFQRIVLVILFMTGALAVLVGLGLI
jgi:uncharacterized membrane protein YfcA